MVLSSQRGQGKVWLLCHTAPSLASKGFGLTNAVGSKNSCVGFQCLHWCECLRGSESEDRRRDSGGSRGFPKALAG